MMNLIINIAEDDDRIRAVYLSGSRVDPNGTYDDIWVKLFEMCKFFHEIASKVAEYFKYEYCIDEAENIMEYLKEMER